MPTLTPPLSRTHAAMLTAACEAMCDDTALRALIDCEMEEGESERRAAWLRELEGSQWDVSKPMGSFVTLTKHGTPYFAAIVFAGNHEWRAYAGFFDCDKWIERDHTDSIEQSKLAAWACLIREGGRT